MYHPNSYHHGSIDEYGNAQHGYSFVSPFAGYGYVKLGDWDWGLVLWNVQGTGTVEYSGDWDWGMFKGLGLDQSWKTEEYSSSTAGTSAGGGQTTTPTTTSSRTLHNPGTQFSAAHNAKLSERLYEI